MIITTTPTIAKYNIDAYLGLVSANQVLGANIISDFIASFTDTFGGSSGVYRERLDNLYSGIVNDIKSKARSMGANAIVGLKIEFDEISSKGKSMFMVTAVGTAVKTSQDRSAYYRAVLELKTFLQNGLIQEIEYEHEISLLKKRLSNPMDEDLKILIRQKEFEEVEKRMQQERIAEEEEKMRKREQTQDGLRLCDKQVLYGFKVGNEIYIKATNEVTTIQGFTEDNKVYCVINSCNRLFEFSDIRLV